MSSWKVLSKASDEASQVRSHGKLHILHSALGQSVALRVVQCTFLSSVKPLQITSFLSSATSYSSAPFVGTMAAPIQ